MSGAKDALIAACIAGRARKLVLSVSVSMPWVASRRLMFALTGQIKVFVCQSPTDMRKGFDGLSGLITNELEQNPLSGALFVFRNRRRDRLKLLYWDQDGYALWYKRLESGTFEFPKARDDEACTSISHHDLSLLLGGIDLRSVRRRKRYVHVA